MTAGQRAEDRVCKCGEQGNGGRYQILLVDSSGTPVVKSLMVGSGVESLYRGELDIHNLSQVTKVNMNSAVMLTVWTLDKMRRALPL